jgi:hypothetical protein
MNIEFQFPKCIISIGMGHDTGFSDVPEDRFMRDIPAGFMSTIPAEECSELGGAPLASVFVVWFVFPVCARAGSESTKNVKARVLIKIIQVMSPRRASG